MPRARGPGSPQAGYWRLIGAPRLVPRKIKAHRTEADASSPAELDIKGNAWADKLAKHAAQTNNLHEPDLLSYRKGLAVYKSVANAMLDMLELWPASKDIFGKLERVPTSPPADLPTPYYYMG